MIVFVTVATLDIEQVHKQLFSRRLQLRVARVAIEKPWSDQFMKLDGDSKKRYRL